MIKTRSIKKEYNTREEAMMATQNLREVLGGWTLLTDYVNNTGYSKRTVCLFVDLDVPAIIGVSLQTVSSPEKPREEVHSVVYNVLAKDEKVAEELIKTIESKL